MGNVKKTAPLRGGVSLLVVALLSVAPQSAGAQAAVEAGAAYGFEIPSKPLLAALADYAKITGLQIVRPGAEKLVGRSRPVSGRLGAEAALREMLKGSGLLYEFTSARTVTLYPLARDAMPVQMAADAIALDDIAVTGESGDAPGRTAGAFTVTSADIARKNPQDVRDLFGGEPGVQVGSSIPMSQKVYVRGVEETNLAVTIDGSAQNNKVFHHNATTYIDPGLLKQARVDPGVAPADAGFGALAGSIAYETKDVADLLGHDRDGVGGIVKGWFNSNGAVFGNSVTGYGKQNGFEALGYFNWADGGRYKNGAGDKVAGTATELMSGLGKLAYESGEGHRFEVSHERVHDDTIRPFRPNLGDVGRVGEPPTRDFKLDRQNTVFNYTDTSPEGWWNPKVVLAYSATKIKVPTFVMPSPGVYVEAYDSAGRTSSLNGKAENKFAFSLGDVTAGVDFRHDRARYSDPNYRALETMTNVGFYTQARLQPIERARLSFGGRVDHQRFDGVNNNEGAEKNHSGLSANVSGEYDLVPELLTAKAGYSHVWAGIPLAENFILNPAWNYVGLNGEKLKAVTSDNYTAGLVARYNGFTLEGSVFKTQIENARNAKFSNAYLPPFGAGRIPGSTFAPELDTRGFEIGAGYAWETGFVRVKYAHIDVDIDGRRGDSDTGNYIATPVGDIITITAAHTFAAWNVTIGGDVEIAAKYGRTGVNPYAAVPGTRYPDYPAYQIVNAFVEYKPQLKYETTLRLDVKNMFDENYSSRATYGSEFGNVTPLFEPGRSFLATATVKF